MSPTDSTPSTAPPNRLRELYKAKGWERYDLAAKIRFDPSTIYRWETGRGDIPDEMKKVLAKLFGVTRAHLMGWDEDEIAA